MAGPVNGGEAHRTGGGSAGLFGHEGSRVNSERLMLEAAKGMM